MHQSFAQLANGVQYASIDPFSSKTKANRAFVCGTTLDDDVAATSSGSTEDDVATLVIQFSLVAGNTVDPQVLVSSRSAVPSSRPWR
jgi:hypothetical protein